MGVKNCTHEIQHIFYSALAVGTPYPGVAIAPRPACSYGLFVREAVCSRYIVYPRHAAVFVLADAGAASTWRPSEGDTCSGRWYELLANNRRWELLLNHCRAMLYVISTSLHGWHLSRNPRALQQFGAWSSCRGSYPASALDILHEGMGCSYDAIHCLPWTIRSHWSLPCSPPQSLGEQIFNVLLTNGFELSETIVWC
jgi:hypothetical protein